MAETIQHDHLDEENDNFAPMSPEEQTKMEANEANRKQVEEKLDEVLALLRSGECGYVSQDSIKKIHELRFKLFKV
ncbi:hypothetical protein LRY60_03175 [Candidatus Woesebacteria bacterium]|nr:hypothetical protein [Candidatus Woesebacteria bacterium]MCD8506779.1 hypothetical protein [Candidatus Woesebacteria bacterium]MCD8546343.1 hypothetical protein [Candidatus Woesebacteria bacterium]